MAKKDKKKEEVLEQKVEQKPTLKKETSNTSELNALLSQGYKVVEHKIKNKILVYQLEK